MNSYSDRLKQALEQAGVSVRQLSADLGISYQAIYSVLNGSSKSLSARNNEEAARRLGVSSRWLASGIGAMKDARQSVQVSDVDGYNASEIVEIRVSGIVRTCFGEASVGQAGRDGSAFFKTSWMDERGLTALNFHGFIMYGKGMEPTIYDGDTIFLNGGSTTPEDGGVFVVGIVDAITHKMEGVVKRLMKRHGVWHMHSDNPDKNLYPNEPMPPLATQLSEILSGEGCFIIGRVIYRQSERI